MKSTLYCKSILLFINNSYFQGEDFASRTFCSNFLMSCLLKFAIIYVKKIKNQTNKHYFDFLKLQCDNKAVKKVVFNT